MTDSLCVDQRLRMLHPEDDVMVAFTEIEAGDMIEFSGGAVRAERTIRLGDKIACVGVSIGAPVRKFGEIIGTATAAIPCGAWVHTHNLRSNYIDAIVNIDSTVSIDSTGAPEVSS